MGKSNVSLFMGPLMRACGCVNTISAIGIIPDTIAVARKVNPGPIQNVMDITAPERLQTVYWRLWNSTIALLPNLTL